jgi:hypothetical protein
MTTVRICLSFICTCNDDLNSNHTLHASGSAALKCAQQHRATRCFTWAEAKSTPLNRSLSSQLLSQKQGLTLVHYSA